MGEIIFYGILVNDIAELLLALYKLCDVFNHQEGHVFVVLDTIDVLDLKLEVFYEVLILLAVIALLLEIIFFEISVSCLRGVRVLN